MKGSGEIRQAIYAINRNGEEVYAKVCRVLAVDEATKTIDVKPVDDTAEIYGVPLQADTQGDGLVISPKKGSFVLVVFTSKNTAVAVMYSVIDKVRLSIGGISVEITDSEIVMNGGNAGGLVKLQELKDSLNSLKQYVEAIHTALPSAFNAIGISTAANGATGAASYQSAMAGKFIQIKEMENKKIKQ
ncbi:MAG: hypothetical protein LBD91_03130 [Prevotellaceae bacterium]|jgi:hypothetical protein|nr:hypothetical protein [Prevotellaceae bacterium]